MNRWIPVLLIDDCESIRNTLKYILRLNGFEVHLAENGEIGLELARKIKPKLILLDWMMPGMDGLEVLAELKYCRKTEHIPVFMLTAKSMVGDIDKAFTVGADNYITKPFDPRTISEAIKKKLKECKKRTKLNSFFMNMISHH